MAVRQGQGLPFREGEGSPRQASIGCWSWKKKKWPNLQDTRSGEQNGVSHSKRPSTGALVGGGRPIETYYAGQGHD